MTKEETVQLLMMISAAYQNFKPENKAETVNVWHMMLEEYDANAIFTALKAYIATNTTGFAPDIGKLISQLNELKKTANPELTETEAWALVSKALRNGAYGSETEFAKLPEDVQKAVGSPEMLRVWATDSDFNESVVSSNFMRSYKTTLKRKNEIERLPQSVRNVILQIGGTTNDKQTEIHRIAQEKEST